MTANNTRDNSTLAVEVIVHLASDAVAGSTYTVDIEVDPADDGSGAHTLQFLAVAVEAVAQNETHVSI